MALKYHMQTEKARNFKKGSVTLCCAVKAYTHYSYAFSMVESRQIGRCVGAILKLFLDVSKRPAPVVKLL